MRNYILSFFVFSVFLFSGCLKKPEQPACNYDACARKAPASEIAAVQHYLDSLQITGTTQHCSGVFYKIDNPGTGRMPNACSRIIANYKGSLTNGNVFDQGQFQQPFSLKDLVQGWTNTIPLIKEGGRIKLYVPPSLGYGPNDYGSIPGNSILIFDVALVAVQ